MAFPAAFIFMTSAGCINGGYSSDLASSGQASDFCPNNFVIDFESSALQALQEVVQIFTDLHKTVIGKFANKLKLL